MSTRQRLHGIATCPIARLVAPALAAALTLALFLPGCGEDNPIQPSPGPDGKGRIAGYAFLAGNPSSTTQITLEIFVHDTSDKVSTLFPDDNGRFLSEEIDTGAYDLLASVPLPGYFPFRRNNITVLANQTTEISTFENPITVPDTTHVLYENLTPTPSTPDRQTLLVDRRPLISGDFSSSGSGFKIETFVLMLRRLPFEFQRITAGLEVEEIEERHRGHFSYQPFSNLEPGQYEVRVSMTNRAGTFSPRTWAFEILKGVTRRVVSPGQTPVDTLLQYATVREAVNAANEGDSVRIDPGVHDVRLVVVLRDVVIMSEQGPGATTLDAGRSVQHFQILDPSRRGVQVTLKGLTLTRGFTPPQQPGGSTLCRDAIVTIEDCTFSDNESGDRAGALALFDTQTRILNCIFKDNYSGSHGGAIGLWDQTELEIAHCLFVRNRSNGNAGAIHTRGPTLSHVHHNTFFRNESHPDRNGGAIYLDFDPIAGSPIMDTDHNLFLENESVFSGGVIYVNGSFLTSDCDAFHKNLGQPIYGNAATPRRSNLLNLEEGIDPLYCNPGGTDLHFRVDSPLFTGECPERGAFPPGCSF